jgi:uncharacterized membrane protein YqjE
MNSDASHGVQASNPALGDSIRSLIASFLSYLELRLKLLGLETRETGLHLLALALLLVTTITFFVSFVAMLIVFLLYLMMLILHWEWGWSALALAGVLVAISIVLGLIFRSRIVKPLFPVTFAEFQNDRQWLEHTTKNSK